MQLNRWMKAILIGGSIMTLAGCHSTRKPNQYDVNNANAAYNNDGAQASGLGDESNFGGGSDASRQQGSERVYYFDFDSNIVRDADKPAINNNAEYLISHPSNKVLLEGHTDPRGSREYNIGLGERRAKAIAEILAAKGVNPAQIRVVSYGAEKLATPGHSESDYQQDRRVVLVYMQK